MAQSSTYDKSASRKTPNASPASQYLQDRLDERRARNSRPRRARQSDIGPQAVHVPARDDDIFIQEGETARSAPRRSDNSPGTRQIQQTPLQSNLPARASSTGGSRHLNEQLDRMIKLNFDLKLEIDHRRAHQVKLNAELEQMRAMGKRAEQLAEEHAELLKINAQLVEELEKRDKAMQEAVEIICDLEERVVELEDDRQSVTRASTIHADSGYAGTDSQEAASSSSPEKLRRSKQHAFRLKVPSVASAKLNNALNGHKAKREPSFAAQTDAETRNLRSVYRESIAQLRPIKSFHSILSKHTSTIDENDYQADALNSPRFSNLSESSFPSIYAPNKRHDNRYAWEPEEVNVPALTTTSRGMHARQDSISRVSEWIEGNEPVPHTSSHGGSSVRTLSPTPISAATMKPLRFQSLNTSLSQPAKFDDPLDMPFRPHTAHDISRRSSRTPTSFGGPIFGEPILSHAHDNASQNLLRSSRSTIIDEKSLSDAPPARHHTLQALEPDLRTTPKQMRSSLELKIAFASNLEYRKTGLHQVQHADDHSPSPELQGANAQWLHPEYLGFPDGGSILLGTPSRFSKPDKRTGKSSDTASQNNTRPVPRRKSSSAATAETRKPDLIRAGTSPNILPSLMTTDAGRRPRTPGVTDAASPLSYQSTSSSNRTTFATTDRGGPSGLEPRSPPRGAERVPPSPARTLSQKTQSLFRRLSGSHGSDKDRSVQISPSPLPTLTSTPSSAYVNIIPKDMRRANVYTVEAPTRSAHLQASQAAGNVQTRTPSRTRSGSGNRQADTATDRRGFFGRRGSFKQGAGPEPSKTATPSGRGRRRSSIREAIASGKRWQ